MRLSLIKFSLKLCCASMVLANISCKKFIEIPPPKNTIGTEQMFQDENQAESAMSGLYTLMINANQATGQASVGRNNWSAGALTLLTSISAGEFEPREGPLNGYWILFINNLEAHTDGIVMPLWQTPYKTIYNANAIIEGIAATPNSSMPEKVRKELSGEAKFVRALAYFYLTNLFGDVPLALTIDFNQTKGMRRTPQSEVYQQILADLKDASINLPADYARGLGERIRPNKWAAYALMARVHLYLKDYPAAAAAASEVIGRTDLFRLEPNLNSVFSNTSGEAVWQLKHAITTSIKNATPEGTILVPSPVYTGSSAFMLSTQLLNAFESGDKRRTDWVDSTNNTPLPGQPPFLTYYPVKYKVGSGNSTTAAATEYYTVFRLAEMYLIRAEAAAYGAFGGPADGVNDINMIRRRAGLTDLPTTLTKDQLLTAIEQERQIELFAEWGHRWLDLKRTGRARDVLTSFPAKLPWRGDHQLLYPVPADERRDNPQLTQNPGY